MKNNKARLDKQIKEKHGSSSQPTEAKTKEKGVNFDEE
jgi:hypothetical protein